MSVVRHSLWAVGSGILVTGSRFVLAAVLARKLSTGSFGQYAYAQWLIDVSFLLCTLGVTGIAGRYFAEYRHRPSILAAIARRWRPYSLGLPVVGAVIACCGAWLSGLRFDLGSYGLLLAWGVGSGLWSMHTAALVGLQRFDLMFASNLVAAAIMLIGAFSLPQGESGLELALAIMTTATVTASLIGIRSIAEAARSPYEDLDPRLWRTIYLYGLNIWLTALMWSLVWSRGEIPVIRGLLGDEAVARYAVALTLYGGAVSGVMLAVSGITPQITRYLGEGNQAAAVGLCRRAMDIQLLLSGLGGLALIWLAPELIELAFGETYKGSAKLLPVLALGLPALTVASHNHLLQIVTGARYNRNTTLLGVLFLLGSAWTGVTNLGVMGAAWARAATLLVLAGITIAVTRRRWGSPSVAAANGLMVVSAVLASEFCVRLATFETLTTRLSAFLLLGVVLLVFVNNSSNAAMAKYLFRIRSGRQVRPEK